MNYMKFTVALYCVFMLWTENETSGSTGADLQQGEIY